MKLLDTAVPRRLAASRAAPRAARMARLGGGQGLEGRPSGSPPLAWVAAGRLEPQCACSARCAFEGLWHAAEASDPLQFRRSGVCGRRAPRAARA